MHKNLLISATQNRTLTTTNMFAYYLNINDLCQQEKSKFQDVKHASVTFQSIDLACFHKKDFRFQF